jgi:hypothetical protein
VTREAGAKVMLTTTVPAGESVLQALDRKTDITTRYGGRFVQSVDGIEGSLDQQRDWFYFVNGIEPGLGAGDVDLEPGDVAWWDYRDWRKQMEAPVVVGAFPEPFVHGWDGKRRPAKVVAPAGFDSEASALEHVLRGPGQTSNTVSQAQGGGPNVFRLVVEPGADGATLTARRGAAEGSPVTFTLSGSEDAVRAAARALAANPAIVRYHYTARFDDAGDVAR